MRGELWKRMGAQERQLQHDIRGYGRRGKPPPSKGKTRAQMQAEKSEIEAYLSRVPDPIKWL